ncbi:hypothetical protein [Clostridium tunisiense]|uniref:hypothetical protein n=1 Tax=Clostridium tunisiense TaxID=219748 RepID=UPI0002E3F313|nr:hypothetical protein [Clostridium tunisiense]
MNLLILEERRLLRYSLLFQLYRDFFTYGYEVCISIDYLVPEDCRKEIIAALYYIYYRKWIFFNIEKDKTVSAYILGLGMEEVEDYLTQAGQLVISSLSDNLLKPVVKNNEVNGGVANEPSN